MPKSFIEKFIIFDTLLFRFAQLPLSAILINFQFCGILSKIVMFVINPVPKTFETFILYKISSFGCAVVLFAKFCELEELETNFSIFICGSAKATIIVELLEP